MTVQLTIIGMGQIGTSIGLALADHKEKIFRVGHDRKHEILREVEKMGAVDKIILNLHAAVEEADIVILAIPMDEIRKTMELIAPDMKEGSVLMDTSVCMTKVGEWAKELLPEERYFVSISPSLNPAYINEMGVGYEAAHADLFENGLVSITTPPGMPADAVRLATELTSILKASPYFADPAEFDGLIAGTYVLPQILSAALANSVMDQPGWTEARKLGGKNFYQGLEQLFYLEEEKIFGQNALNNPENNVRVINNLIMALQDLRDAISEGNELELHSLMEKAQMGRSKWYADRKSGEWHKGASQVELPSAGETLSRFLTGGLFQKKKDKK